jgi:Spy/CpxP family protein refolding chaperone
MKRALLITTVVLSALLIVSVAFAHRAGYGSRSNYGYDGRCGDGFKGRYATGGYGLKHDGAGRSMFGYGLRGAGFCLRYGDELGLSKKQVDVLEDLQEEFAKARIEKRAALDELRLELSTLLDENKINLSKAKSLSDKIADVQAELRYMRIEEAAKIRELLNEEQLDKLNLPRREYRGRGEGIGSCPYD